MYSKRKHKVGLTREEVMEHLSHLYHLVKKEPTRVVFDTETRQYGIDCIGICYKENESFTIPITEVYNTVLDKEEEVWIVTDKKEELTIGHVGQTVRKFRHYWSIEDEIDITHLLHMIMLHPNCLHVGQNYIYDCTFYFRQWLLYINSHCDTMTLQHVLYNCDPKKLDYLASIYSPDYTYWKNERNTGNNMERWVYCGKDCCHNYTVAKIMNIVLKSRSEKLQEFYKFQQFCMLPATFDMSLEGIKVDVEEKTKQYNIFNKLVGNAIDTFHYMVGEAINLNSAPQIKRFFKDLLGIKPITVGKTKESFGAAACKGYLVDYPHLKYAITLLLEYKSLKIFVTNFLGARVDVDGRMRCSVNLDATKTYRCSMSKNLDGGGVNMQTIPEKGKIDIEYALAILGEEDEVEEEVF
jgi:DNA polymerase I-like protein with 3'-5' exonuclease and polymerase domains